MPVGAAACLGTVLSAALPPGPARDLAYLATALGSIVAIAVGTRRHRPDPAATWYLLGAGLTSWLAGNAVLALAGPGATARLVGTVLYAALYPLVLLGLMRAVVTARGHEWRTGLLDTAIRTAAVAMVMWVLVVEPAIASYAGSPAELAWTLGPAVGNLLIFGGARAPGDRRRRARHRAPRRGSGLPRRDPLAGGRPADGRRSRAGAGRPRPAVAAGRRGRGARSAAPVDAAGHDAPAAHEPGLVDGRHRDPGARDAHRSRAGRLGHGHRTPAGRRGGRDVRHGAHGTGRGADGRPWPA